MEDPAHDVHVGRRADGWIADLRFTTEHPANVITIGLLEAFHAALDTLADEPPRVLTVRGQDRLFGAGADLTSIRDMDDDAYRGYIDAEYRLFRRVEGLPFVTIAVLRGPCIGNAAELALACDLRVAADSTRFGFPEPKVGFVAPSQRLTRFVGIGRAKELLYTGAVLRAGDAMTEGLFTRLVADDDLDAEAAKLADEYAAYAPVALRLTKQGLARSYGIVDGHDAAEQEAAYLTFKTADFREGSAAALERRAARFQGR